MPETYLFNIRTSFLSKKKQLELNEEFLELKNNQTGILYFHCEKEEIDCFRYEAKKVRWYGIYIYYYYKIDIKIIDKKTIKIRAISPINFFKNDDNNYSKILSVLYKLYFKRLAIHYLDFFSNNIDFEISGLVITNEGVIFSKKSPVLPWNEVEIINYWGYFTLYSKKDSNSYKTFYNWSDWNSMIVNVIVSSIIEHKSILRNSLN